MATATSRSRPTPDRSSRSRRTGAWTTRSSLVLYGLSGALLLALVGLASVTGSYLFVLVLGALAAALMALGPERLGLAMLGVAFLTAPLSKGSVVQVAGPSLTLTDVAFVAAAGLLLPRLIHGRVSIAPLYLFGAALTLVCGVFASVVMTDQTGTSLKTLIALAYCLLVIPLVLVTIAPNRRLLVTFAWTFVTAHTLNTLYSIAMDPTAAVRHMGLTQHPNALAQSGVMSFALLLFLRRFSGSTRLVYAAMGVSVLSVYLSGSRGGTIALAVMIAAVPLVERTATVTSFVLVLGFIGALSLSYLVQRSSEDSSLRRLTGTGDAALSNSERQEGLQYGMDRFLEHPITGSGFIDLGPIHINLLEIAVASGIFGLLGFLLVLWAMGRQALSMAPERVLVYLVLGFVVFGLGAPALTDRAAWLTMALGIAVFHGYRDPVPGPDDVTAAGPTAGSR